MHLRLYLYLLVCICRSVSVSVSLFPRAPCPQSACIDPNKVQASMARVRRSQARLRAQTNLDAQWTDPVPGRTHQDIQTEPYLEELTENVDETAVACQTDSYLDRVA